MKVNYYVFLVLFLTLICYSQKSELIKGKVGNFNFAMKGVDVVNFNSKKATVSDENGNFEIFVKPADVLIFIYKGYYDKKYIITQNDFDKKYFSIILIAQPIEIEEVKVKSVAFEKFGIDQMALDKLKLEKQFSTPKVIGVYDGTITNGLDFARMFTGISNLCKKIFKKDMEPIKKTVKVEFKDYLKDNFKEDFYLNTLKLKQDEIFSFIEFCDADVKSKALTKDINVLSVMDFLIAKNIEYTKIKGE